MGFFFSAERERKKRLTLFISEMVKNRLSTAKTQTNYKTETNHDNVKLSKKNVYVVEKDYITGQKYLTRKGKLALYWLILLGTMTTPLSSFLYPCGLVTNPCFSLFDNAVRDDKQRETKTRYQATNNES